MANYDLGTAHGKIVVDYQDKGTGKAAKDLDALKAKAGELLGQFGRLARGWRSHSQGMVNDVTRLARAVGVFAGALALGVGLLNRSRGAFLAYKGIGQIFGALGLAMGGVPKGAEGFPGVVKKIIQLSAAVTLFAGATKLIQTVASRFGLLKGIGNLIGNLGSRVDGLARPLHRVAGVALAAAGAINTFRTIKAIIPIALKGASAVGALGGAFVLLGGLVQSVKQLTGVIGLLPAVAGTAVLGFAALKIATMGLSDAFENWDDPAKFAEALKKLHPEAAKTVVAIKSLEGQFKAAQKNIQGRLFDGMAKSVQELGSTYIPILEERFGRVVDVINSAGKGVINFLKSTAGVSQSKNILDKFAATWENLGPSIEHIVMIIMDIAEVSAGVFEDLTDGAEGTTRSWAEFIDKARETGQIKEWIQGGLQALKDLWATVKNVSATFKTMWVALNGGESVSFLAMLASATARMREFVASAEGQRILSLLATTIQTLWEKLVMLGDAFVTHVLPVLERFLPIVTAVGSGIMTGIVAALAILNPLFMALGAVLGPLAPVFQVIATVGAAFVVTLMGIGLAAKIAFVAFNTLSTAFTVVRVAIQLTSFLISSFAVALLKGIANLTIWVVAHTVAAARTAAAWLVAKAQVIAHWAAIAAAATLNAIKVGAAWLLTTGASMATAVASMAATVARVVAGWVLMGIQAMIGAAKMAAAWFIAMGPIGWVIAGIIALVALIIVYWDEIAAATTAVWDTVWGAIKAAWDAIWNVIGPTMNRIGAAIQSGFNKAKAVVDTVMNAIKIVIQTVVAVVVAIFTGNFNQIPGILQGAGARMNALFGGALTALKNAVMSGLAAVVAFFQGIPGKILGALGNLGGLLVNAGRAVLQGFLDGLKAMWGAVTGFVGGIASWISANKGPVSKDAKLLKPAGNAIMRGLVDGMNQSMPLLKRTVGNVNSTLAGAASLSTSVNLGATGAARPALSTGVVPARGWSGPTPSGGDGAAAPVTNNIDVTIPAKDIAEMQTVADFFDKVQQKARAGKAGR